jgi:Cytochrome c
MKTLKKILVGVSAIIGLLVAVVTTKFYVLSPKIRPAPNMTAPTSPEAIARGAYLANSVSGCVACHSKVDDAAPGQPLYEEWRGAGRDFGVMPGFPGLLRSRNLTPDKDTGIASWTDGEIVRAMREGVSRDGRALFPLMPYRTFAEVMSDEDALDIVAYLRSLKPVSNDPPPTRIDFPVSMFIRGVPAPLEKSPPPAPDESDVLGRGTWLLKAANCSHCHDAVDNHRKPIPGGRLGGGAPFTSSKGVVYASNLTSDKETGIGSYSDEDIAKALSSGIAKDGRRLYVMPWAYFTGLTPGDQRALITALRTVAPVKNAVPPPALN